MKIFTMSGQYEKAVAIAKNEEQAREVIENSYYTRRDIEDWKLNNIVDLGNSDVKPQLVSHYSE